MEHPEPPGGVPHLSADEADDAPVIADAARRARAFTLDDWHGRRLRLYLVAPLATCGGYWYASAYEPGVGTVNVYAGQHRAGPRATRPACLTEEGLRRASDAIEARVAAHGLNREPEASPQGCCPTCGQALPRGVRPPPRTVRP